MIERIATVLFKPRTTARFIIDKAYRVISYFFIMLILSILPMLNLIKNGVVIDHNEYRLLTEAIRDTNGSLLVDNGVTNASEDFYIRTGLYNFAFDKVNYSDSKYNVIISNNTYKLYLYGFELKSGIIELNNMFINKDSNLEDISEFTSVLYSTIYDNSLIIKISYVVNGAISLVLRVLFFLIAFYFIGSFINNRVIGKFRWIIAVYSLFPYLIINAFATLLGFSVLSFLGLVYSYVSYAVALKAIVKIEVRKE